MSDIVISAENLGKKYIIGHQNQQESYTALRDVVGRTIKGLARSAQDMIHGRAIVPGDNLEDFWALKDINFEIKRGEVVGIIGRNGAGKSTLLKILSRITEPSEGRVTIKGRVASLLEVGTGFHPELTGRENIYLNGAILGMTRAEIRKKFDEIVAFAEVEKFLDTPVKRYSSGMYVRLAFAVAAHLEPEILVVDEVLAVGDVEFQKKCLGKMKDVAGNGRTVLFVSHQLGMVSQLCKHGLLLSSGELAMKGLVRDVIDKYINAAQDDMNELLVSEKFIESTRAAILTINTLTQDNQPSSEFAWDDTVRIRINICLREYIPGLCIGISLTNRIGFVVTTWVKKINEIIDKNTGEFFVDLDISTKYIAPGSYVFNVALFLVKGKVYHDFEAVCPILIHESGSSMAAYSHFNYGLVILPAKWVVDSDKH